MGRNKLGRWEPGTSGNPGGRPRRETEEDYLKALSDGVDKRDWRAIIKKAVEQAKKGDYRARQWLSEYLIGKATQYLQADVSTYSETAFIELLALMDPLIADEHREAYEEQLKKLSDRLEGK